MRLRLPHLGEKVSGVKRDRRIDQAVGVGGYRVFPWSYCSPAFRHFERA